MAKIDLGPIFDSSTLLTYNDMSQNFTISADNGTDTLTFNTLKTGYTLIGVGIYTEYEYGLVTVSDCNFTGNNLTITIQGSFLNDTITDISGTVTLHLTYMEVVS